MACLLAGWLDGWLAGLLDRWIDGWMIRWIWMDGMIEFKYPIHPCASSSAAVA